MIRYSDSLDGITTEHLHGYFVGWPKPVSPEMHLELLDGSDEVVLAVDDETNRVVGFITAVSDGVRSAYIPLLEVLPEYRGRGVGSELMRRMLEKLGGLYMIDLVCDADVQPFYERFGMTHVNGMKIRDRRAIR